VILEINSSIYQIVKKGNYHQKNGTKKIKISTGDIFLMM